jgi:hypothetical protein
MSDEVSNSSILPNIRDLQTNVQCHTDRPRRRRLRPRLPRLARSRRRPRGRRRRRRHPQTTGLRLPLRNRWLARQYP